MPSTVWITMKSPLYYACRHGRADIFATLVEAGADLEATCDDILPIDDMYPTPRCNLIKLTLDAKYFDLKFDWPFECGWGTSFDRQWDPIINTFLSQGMTFDPGHPLIAYHLQTACTQGRPDIVDLILRPEDKAFQSLLAEDSMVTGLALPAAPESATRAGQSAIIEKLLALGTDPRTPFPVVTIVPAPFEAKRLFQKEPVSPLAGPSWMLSYRYLEDYNCDGVARSLELMVIAGDKQPEDDTFKEECAKILQGYITHGHVVPAGHLLDRGLRPLAITKCTSPAGLDLCVQRGIYSLVNW
jgi:ankyrin repeat protein